MPLRVVHALNRTDSADDRKNFTEALTDVYVLHTTQPVCA
jgi:hypothetical protein